MIDQPSAISRDIIVATARLWLGTPYHHQASVRGIGTDCLGLVRGIYRDLYGDEPASVPGYSRDWAEASGEETLLTAARTHLLETAIDAARPGDVLIFRWRDGLAAKHAGLICGPDRMIHAVEGAPVCEVSLSPWWHRHCAAAFSFPRISD
jgi:NlpC/P60 family putative phage cell wall peptidase